ncbi:hypothetical protein QJS10_CPB11g00382 [Acorus calamus]|uniref:Uncharacterized protein n=1 Tax=Acorus calamus TaxID=4465 RepID=A0AAV9DZ76_ACOCL|nr:hypothetical protein QJS10_CPB11g00382 [Acorus calamus]
MSPTAKYLINGKRITEKTPGWCLLLGTLVEDAWDQRCALAREAGRVPTRVITFVETRLATEARA